MRDRGGGREEIREEGNSQKGRNFLNPFQSGMPDSVFKTS